ncbi:hypothetical protein SpCBS45565_g05240 [Spizellomyces sp. 'palustris']|nr:hypothetical protein SpCBS45565_g05240 [Spizellomyces sp. 'palustris']
MEGTGYRDDTSSTFDSGSSSWHSHGHSHHSHHSSSSFVPGLLLGALGGAFGASWWRSNNPAAPPPAGYFQQQPLFPNDGRTYYPAPSPVRPQPQHPYYPQYSPVPAHPSTPQNVPFLPDPVFVMPGPPPTPARKRACSLSCCLCILLVIAIVIAAMLVPKPGTHDVKVVVGDRKVVSVDSKWFKEVEVAGASQVDVYLFNQVPPLDDVVQLSKNINVNLERGSYHFVRYDLHPGSTVHVTWDFNSYNVHPTFAILESEAAFQAWKANAYIPPQWWLHDQNTPKGTYTFTAPDNSEYYFIFYSPSRRAYAKGTASFQVKAITYSISNPAAHCPAGSNDICSFTLFPGREADLLFVAPTVGDSYTMTYKTKPRREAYAALFASLSSAVGVCLGVALIAWCGQKCCGMICGRKERRGYEPISDGQGAEERRAGQSSPRGQGPHTPPQIPPFNPAVSGRYGDGRPEPSAPPPYSVMDPNVV